jgi:hypothetical protein
VGWAAEAEAGVRPVTGVAGVAGAAGGDPDRGELKVGGVAPTEALTPL